MSTPVEIIGAGPAGLSAALIVARLGGQAVVYEHCDDVGHRFHGDFQGLENWTEQGDVLEELRELGIATDFDQIPIRDCVFWDASGREYAVRSGRPLFYLVRRGTCPGSLDQALKMQALDAGVGIRFGIRKDGLPGGGIVAHGPRRADVISSGYVFKRTPPTAYSRSRPTNWRLQATRIC